VQWNDELPAAAALGNTSATPALSSGTSGHTKGVIGGGAGGGFFLTHTLPKFPDLTQGTFSWGSASTLYAQNFLCLSLDLKNLEAASAGMQFNDPHVYDSAIPSGLVNGLPATAALVAGQRSAGTRVATLATRGGDKFLQVSKSGSTGIDLYEDVLQVELQQDMLVETWRRSPMMDTYCQPTYAWDSINVNGLTFQTEGGASQPLKYTQDHSKLAVTAPLSPPGPHGNVTCVGDMNRMTSQWARGGGTTCFLNAPALHAAFLATFTGHDDCF